MVGNSFAVETVLVLDPEFGLLRLIIDASVEIFGPRATKNSIAVVGGN